MRGSGKGSNSRYGGYWKQEKVFFFFNGGVSAILQLVVATTNSKLSELGAKASKSFILIMPP